MEVLYRSTRGNEESVSASKAILEGLASDGGLFVPQALPSFDKTLDEFAQMDYRQTAYEVMKLLLTDFTEEELFPIESVTYTDPEKCGGYGPVVLKLADGTERKVEFEGIEGKLML